MGRLQGQALATSRTVALPALAQAVRWTALCQAQAPRAAEGTEVGELFRVVRGQVTGCNDAWVLPPSSAAQDRAEWHSLPPGLALPAVTRAREIIDGTVEAPDAKARLKRVLNLPHDLQSLTPELRAPVAAFLEQARQRGAASGYIARQRKDWHALDLRAPPAAFVSYMGRRPPVFRTNPHGVTYLNIAHGLYPREPLSLQRLRAVLDHLNISTDLYSGRVYGGGLAKFEPSDVARLRIPARVLAGAPALPARPHAVRSILRASTTAVVVFSTPSIAPISSSSLSSRAVESARSSAR